MNYPRRSALPSPCRQICQLDDHDVCIGCARTRNEIGEWSQASIDRQAEILKSAAQRAGATAGEPAVQNKE